MFRLWRPQRCPLIPRRSQQRARVTLLMNLQIILPTFQQLLRYRRLELLRKNPQLLHLTFLPVGFRLPSRQHCLLFCQHPNQVESPRVNPASNLTGHLVSSRLSDRHVLLLASPQGLLSNQLRNRLGNRFVVQPRSHLAVRQTNLLASPEECQQTNPPSNLPLSLLGSQSKCQPISRRVNHLHAHLRIP